MIRKQEILENYSKMHDELLRINKQLVDILKRRAKEVLDQFPRNIVKVTKISKTITFLTHINAQPLPLDLNININLKDEDEKKLESMLIGLIISDGSYHRSYFKFEVHSLFQETLTLLLLLALQKKLGVSLIRIDVSGISLTSKLIRLRYYIRFHSSILYQICKRKRSKQCKMKLLEEIKKKIESDASLFFGFLYGYWIGDGTTSNTRMIRIKDEDMKEAMYVVKEELERLGYHVNFDEKSVRIEVSGEAAANIAQQMLNSIPKEFMSMIQMIPDDLRWKDDLMRVAQYRWGTMLVHYGNIVLGTPIYRPLSLYFTRTSSDKSRWVGELKEKGINVIVRGPQMNIPMIDSMKIVCCDETVKQQIIEIAKKSRQRYAEEWNDLNKVTERCERFFKIYGVKCPAQWDPEP